MGLELHKISVAASPSTPPFQSQKFHLSPLDIRSTVQQSAEHRPICSPANMKRNMKNACCQNVAAESSQAFGLPLLNNHLCLFPLDSDQAFLNLFRSCKAYLITCVGGIQVVDVERNANTKALTQARPMRQPRAGKKEKKWENKHLNVQGPFVTFLHVLHNNHPLLPHQHKINS